MAEAAIRDANLRCSVEEVSPPSPSTNKAAPSLRDELQIRCAAADDRSRLLVIAPRTEPSVSAPLGWVLSEATRKDLDDAMEVELNSGEIRLEDLMRQLSALPAAQP